MSLPDGLTYINYMNNIDNCRIISKLLTNNYVEDNNHSFRYNFTPEFIQWYLNSSHSINVGIVELNILIGFICGRAIRIMLNGIEQNVAEISFLCVHKTMRMRRLCPLLINEITRQFTEYGITEAIYTSEHKYAHSITSVNYYIRCLNIKKLVEIGYLKSSVSMDELHKIYTLQPFKGSRKLVQLENNIKHITKCYELYNTYYKQFECYDVLTLEMFQYMLVNDHVTTFMLMDNNNIIDFISYYIVETNVLKLNTTTLDAYLYYYTNTSKHLHKMFLMLLHELFNKVDTFMALNTMDKEEDIFTSLKFQQDTGNFNYYLFKNNKVRISANKLAKIIF